MTTDHAQQLTDIDLEGLFAMAGVFGGDCEQLGEMLNDNPDLLRRLNALSPQTATAFGALLIRPELQASAVRIEAMIHLAVAHCKGTQSPSGRLACQLFDYLGPVIGHMEDPAEDLMIAAIRSNYGNFRIISGLWEGAGFFLQRFVDVVQNMPRGEDFEAIRRPVIALLRLSEEMCDRANLLRHAEGAEMPVGAVSKPQLTCWMKDRNKLSFSDADLQRLSIDPADLQPFLFEVSDSSLLLSETLGNSSLERRPLMVLGQEYHLVLPNGISAALRYWIIDALTAQNRRESLCGALGVSYAHLIHEMHLFGGVSGANLKFQPDGDTLVAETCLRFDVGRTIHFVFFTDKLDGMEKTGLSGINPPGQAMNEMFERRIAAGYQAAAADPDYKEGMSLLVGCGVGRGEAIAVGGEALPNWRVESCAAHDLLTMSCLHRFRTANLWRILQAKDRIQSLGLNLPNVNGLLNLVSWSRAFDGHLVPHGDVPDTSPEGGTVLLMAQNSLRDLRREAAFETDFRVEQFIDGTWLRLRRDAPSVFEADRAAPLFGSEDPGPRGMPMVAFVSRDRVWWADVENPEKVDGNIAYQRWRMAGTWLSRSVFFLEEALSLPDGPILWDLIFHDDREDRRLPRERLDYETARAAIKITIDAGLSIIRMEIGSDFDQAIFHPENIAERALVSALIQGAALLAGEADVDQVEAALLHRIVTDPNARHSHAFAQRGFRDHVRISGAGNKLVRITREDDAFTRLNLGWSVRDRQLGPKIIGKAECTRFLNSVVTYLQDDLIHSLRAFHREQILQILLINHELAVDDRDRWLRTSSALMGLHGKTSDTVSRIIKAEQSLNAVFQSTRTLVEMAICECPLEAGAKPGKLDLSLLMAKASLLFEIGGWSDAIRWDVMKPEIHVTPLGDLHANFSFLQDIIQPHAYAASGVRIEHAVSGYATNLEERPTSESVEGDLDNKFVEAWNEQIGAKIDQVRLFIDAIEQMGLEADKKVIKVERARLKALSFGDYALEPDTVDRILDVLTLATRQNWRDVPEGYEERDRHPWRFRRRLSFLRRPILDWDPSSETLLIAPGMLRDALMYLYSLYESGDFPRNQLKPKMAAWHAFANGRRGTIFAEEVAQAMRADGWKAEVEVKVTKLLGRGFEKDHGDVDVLAWRDDGRVLAIECKDVQFRKTLGEMSEQLADFRGEIRSNGKRDELRKHLDRMEVIRGHLSLVAKYTGLTSLDGVESHLLFRNPVPMEFALSRMSGLVRVRNFGSIREI
jgi:hypothetical protein